MKRTPLKRSTIPLRRVSKKRAKLLRGSDGYTAFSKHIRASRPVCEAQAPGCTYRTQGVHHVIKRSHGGALSPGEQADRQGQVFMAVCNACNLYIEDNPRDAAERGWVKRNVYER